MAKQFLPDLPVDFLQSAIARKWRASMGWFNSQFQPPKDALDEDDQLNFNCGPSLLSGLVS